MRGRTSRRSTYWWNDEIASLRVEAIAAKRAFCRARGPNVPARVKEERKLAYKRAKKALNKEIAQAKDNAWLELLASIEDDPWGLPYRLVTKKLMVGTNFTETLEPEVLSEVLRGLFPEHEIVPLLRMDIVWSDDWNVTPGEVTEAIREKRSLNTAPGCDGIKPLVFRLISGSMVAKLAKVFTHCLRRGLFPGKWKVAQLILIQVNPGEALKVRPIALISESGKLLERIIVRRMRAFMAEESRARLSENQFGFRPGLSTVDALFRVKGLVHDAMNSGGVALAVGLDIKNAFNSHGAQLIPLWVGPRKGFRITLGISSTPI